MSEYMSPTITKLVAALSKAQSKIDGAKKDSSNLHFKSKYADLHSIWEACRDALVENEFCITQIVASEGDKPVLVTLLLHVSGEWLKSTMPIIQSKPDIQGFGSALTYCRRYSLASIICCCSVEDDDGEKARQSDERARKIEEARRQEEAKKEAPATIKDLFRAFEEMDFDYDPQKLKDYVKYCADRRGFDESEVVRGVMATDLTLGKFKDYFLEWSKPKAES